MELDEFVQKFADCFNQTDGQKIVSNTNFKKLDEWGSMMALIVIAMVDSDFGKTITSEDLKNAQTVGDLFEIVNKK